MIRLKKKTKSSSFIIKVDLSSLVLEANGTVSSSAYLVLHNVVRSPTYPLRASEINGITYA